jgi:hypothetical protein
MPKNLGQNNKLFPSNSSRKKEEKKSCHKQQASNGKRKVHV